MNLKKVLFALFVIVLTGCSRLDAYFERSTVVILAPQNGLRIAAHLEPGQTGYTPLTLKLISNNPDFKVVRIYVNGVGPAMCTLYPGEIKDCGSIPLLSDGPQTVTVQMDIMDGVTVYSTQTISSAFLLAPYAGWDVTAQKIAQIFGKETPLSGYKFLVLVLVLTFILTGYFIPRRSVVRSFNSGWVALLLVTVIYGFSGSLIAESLVLGFGILCILLGFAGALLRFYLQDRERRQRTVPLKRKARKINQDDLSEEDVIDVSPTADESGEYLPRPIPTDPEILTN